jgi:glycosyltransferase involved in cell wall biosynthesis
MKIAQVYIKYYPHSGGIEKHIHDISEGLSKRGYKISIITTLQKEDRDLKKEEEVEKIKIRRVRSFFGDIAFSPGLLTTDFSCDITHIHSFHPWFFTNMAAICSIKEKIPYVVTPHFHPARRNLRGLTKTLSLFYEDSIGTMILKKADAVIALTPSEKTYYHKIGLDSVFLVPNGVAFPKIDISTLKDLRQKYKSEDEKIVLFVGRILGYKGLQVIVQALPHLLKNSRVCLLVVGRDTGFLRTILQIANENGCIGHMKFLAGVSETDLACLYELADVLVQPSLYEAFGLTVIEAWAHKKPVIVSNCGGLADLVKEGGGIIETSMDPDKWANDISLLLRDDDMNRRLGEEGHLLVAQKYSIDRVCDKLEKVYEYVEGRR